MAAVPKIACIHCHERKVRCDANVCGFPCTNCVSKSVQDCLPHTRKRKLAGKVSQEILGQAHPRLIVTSGSDQLHIPAETCTAPPRIVPENGVQLVRYKQNRNGFRVTYIGNEFSNLNFLVKQKSNAEGGSRYHFHSDRIARRFMTDKLKYVPLDALALPAPGLADRLIAAYFASINPWCPLIDEELFMRQYFSHNEDDKPSLLVLQAILLVGAHVLPDVPDRTALKSTLFSRTKALLDAGVEWNRDSIVQAALLLTWYSDGEEDIGSNAWYYVGLAARLATGLGMHIDSDKSSILEQDKRIWKRIWWILVQFDVFVSLSYGRPQAINLEDCTVSHLVATDFEGIRNCSIDCVIKQTEISSLMSNTIRQHFSTGMTSDQRGKTLPKIDEALAAWYGSLPANVQLDTAGGSMPSCLPHLIYNNFLILLHRPSPKSSQARKENGSNDAEICSAAASSIITIFDLLRKSGQLPYLPVFGVDFLHSAMIQVSVETRLSNPILALSASKRFDTGLAVLRVLAEFWESAENIARLFEESSNGQCDSSNNHHIHGQSWNCPSPDMPSSPILQPGVLSKSGQTTPWKRRRHSLSSYNQAHHNTGGVISTSDGNSEGEPGIDWRHLFPNLLPGVDDMHNDMSFMESEWRDIYWQDLTLFDTQPT